MKLDKLCKWADKIHLTREEEDMKHKEELLEKLAKMEKEGKKFTYDNYGKIMEMNFPVNVEKLPKNERPVG